MMSIGEELIALCQLASKELVLIAPFIKEYVIRRLINDVRTGVSIVCVTRWHPDEIKMGVSDIGVWKALVEKGNAKLFLLSNLHAKYYRADSNILVGSANLTQTALGWSAMPNVELMVPDHNNASLLNWEVNLFKQCIEVDESLVSEIERLIALLPEFISLNSTDLYQDGVSNEPTNHTKGTVSIAWLPTLRYPAQLYKAYSGHAEELSTGAKTSALSDLKVFNLSKGLSEPAFNAAVSILMLQMPLISQVDRFLNQPRRFGEVRELLKSVYGNSFDSSRVWQTLMRWMLHFLPERYKLAIPHHSEIVYRVNNGIPSNPPQG